MLCFNPLIHHPCAPFAHCVDIRWCTVGFLGSNCGNLNKNTIFFLISDKHNVTYSRSAMCLFIYCCCLLGFLLHFQLLLKFIGYFLCLIFQFLVLFMLLISVQSMCILTCKLYIYKVWTTTKHSIGTKNLSNQYQNKQIA